MASDVLVELVNKGRLNDLWLLSSSSRTDGLSGSGMVVHIGRFSRAIGGGGGVACARPIAIGTAMDGGRSARGRRSNLHGITGGLAGGRNGGGKDRNLAGFAGRIDSSEDKRTSGRGIGETAHLARRNRGGGRREEEKQEEEGGRGEKRGREEEGKEKE